MTSQKKHLSAYSGEQLDKYLDRIKIPSRYRENTSLQLNLDLLAAIQRHHLSNIPFDGVKLHYASPRGISLDPQDIYNKLIGRSHGGYCMEQNCLLAHMLLALGFDLYTTGARVQKRTDGVPNGSWYGWTHMLVIVTITEGERYVVDVGYGGDNPVEPLLLAQDVVTANIGTQEKRVVKGSPDFLMDRDKELWLYQTRYSKEKPWVSCYCFAEIEYIPQDYAVMNAWTSTSPESYLTHTFVALIMLMRDERIYGKLMLHGADLRQNTGGRTELLHTCKSEAERIDILEKYFGIFLTEAERNAIKGTQGEIRTL